MAPAHGHTNPVLTGFFVATVLVLSACTTLPVAQLDAAWPADLPEQVELGQVPFFAQENDQCGPAALAMVAGAAGVSVSPDALVEQVFLPARQAALQPEMLATARRQGLLAYPLTPQWPALLREVAAGHPVLVFQNLSLPVYPVWHYAVVIGFDRQRHELLLNSGRSARLRISFDAFERTWARGQYWAMLALPPDQLPATAEPDTLLRAAAALERVNVAAASQAYAAALRRWPQLPGALLGAGNTAYALGQRDAAMAAYQQALHQQPDFAEAWNNLAQVLFDLRRLGEARQAIAQAVALGGVRRPVYLELQRQIDAVAPQPAAR